MHSARHTFGIPVGDAEPTPAPPFGRSPVLVCQKVTLPTFSRGWQGYFLNATCDISISCDFNRESPCQLCPVGSPHRWRSPGDPRPPERHQGHSYRSEHQAAHHRPTVRLSRCPAQERTGGQYHLIGEIEKAVAENGLRCDPTVRRAARAIGVFKDYLKDKDGWGWKLPQKYLTT